jgi:hypothetical protein
VWGGIVTRRCGRLLVVASPVVVAVGVVDVGVGVRDMVAKL